MSKDQEAREDAVQAATESGQDSKNDSRHEESAEASADERQNDIDPEATIDDLERELADLKDQLLRKSADFDNYRKRMQREKEEFAVYANRELLLDIVPIVDDFERAIKSGEESKDFTSFHDGIVMIEKQFASMLERKWRLKRFDSAGEEFDPQRHEAMMTEDAPGSEHPIVLEDFQKGYLLNDRVLRSAKVKVAMPVSKGSAQASASETDDAGAPRDSSSESDG